jgi:DNA-binding NarL/FixJ family response regulator
MNKATHPTDDIAQDGGNGQGMVFLVVDDHQLVREGLKLILGQMEPGVETLEAADVAEAIGAFRARPDVDLILLDLNMPGASGLSALDEFMAACPGARIVVISASYDMQTVRTGIRNGALGFVPKSAGKDAMLGALRFVLGGGIYVPPEALFGEAAPSAAAQEAPAPSPVPACAPPEDLALTARQIEVLRLLMDGKSNKQICRDMNLALGTVKGHIAAILGAFHVSSRAEAIAAADRRGWRAWIENPAAGHGP